MKEAEAAAAEAQGQPRPIDNEKLSMWQLKQLPMHEKFAFLKGAPKAAGYGDGDGDIMMYLR
jgi:hypothetical protein